MIDLAGKLIKRKGLAPLSPDRHHMRDRNAGHARWCKPLCKACYITDYKCLNSDLLERSAPITAESQVFLYGNYNNDLVMHVIEAVVPGTAQDFIKNELFGKMGITNYNWRTHINGIPESGWRTRVTSRAMVKIGTLAMNKGKWDSEQLVPEAFITKALSSILYTGDDDVFGGGKDVSGQGYGYYWWNANLKHEDKSYFSVSAQGGGGQYIILIDELDLMVVATAHDRDNNTLQIMAERIVPAFIQ